MKAAGKIVAGIVVLLFVGLYGLGTLSERWRAEEEVQFMRMAWTDDPNASGLFATVRAVEPHLREQFARTVVDNWIDNGRTSDPRDWVPRASPKTITRMNGRIVKELLAKAEAAAPQAVAPARNESSKWVEEYRGREEAARRRVKAQNEEIARNETTGPREPAARIEEIARHETDALVKMWDDKAREESDKGNAEIRKAAGEKDPAKRYFEHPGLVELVAKSPDGAEKATAEFVDHWIDRGWDGGRPAPADDWLPCARRETIHSVKHEMVRLLTARVIGASK